MGEPFPDNDLGQKPDEPGNYEDREAISSRISKRLSIDRFQRSAFERDWYRNVLFIAGAQWITLDKGRWRPRQLPSWFPRAMTNKFAEKYNDIVSAIVASKPTIHHLPATDDDISKATAEVSERVRDVFCEEAKVETKRQVAASWLVATGNVFLMPWYDNDDRHGTTEQPYQTCVTCSNTVSPSELAEADETCPQCGGNSFMDEPNGMVENFPVGAFQCDVASPFEIRVDHRIPRLDDHQWFIRQRRYDVEYAKDRWPDFADDIKSDYGFDLSQYYLDVLANISSSYSYSGGYMGAGPSSPKNPKVTVYEYFELPSEDYPEGMHAIRLGMESAALVESKPLDFEYGAGSRKGKKFLPLTHMKFDTVPGRFWGKTRLDDLIPLQTFRNVVEANLRLTAQRMGNGIWLKPKGCGVGVITGEPGQEIDYNPVSFGGTNFAKPERVPAELANLQPMIMLMNKIDDSMERVSGTFFLQGGECVTAETECLTARGWTKHADVKVGDSIFSLDSETGKGVWATVNRIYRNPDYAGSIFDINSQTISGGFTPGHDFLAGNVDDSRRANNGRGRPRMRKRGLFKTRIEELKTHHYIPSVAPLAVKREELFSDDFVRLVGWVVTDGHYDRERGRVAISQSRRFNSVKCRQIEKMFRRLFGDQKEGVWFKTERASGMNEYAFYKGKEFIAQFPEKLLTLEFVHSLSTRQLEILLDAMMLGDGHRATRDAYRKHKSARYSSASESLADQFQMVATLAGYTTSKSFRQNKHKGEFRISLKSTKRISWMRVRPKVSEKYYEGLVWCPNTSTGNWVARHNGKVFVTGNTPPGVTAASALAFLGERAQKAMSPILREWAHGWKSFEEHGLEICRANWNDKRIRMIAGRNRVWEVQTFSKEDLQGDVVMYIDDESMFPKSQATERANIAQLLQGQVISPADPEVQYHILEKFGATGLKGSQDEDVRAAVKEAERFLATDETRRDPQVRPWIDNSIVHFMKHVEFAKTDEFMEMPKERQDVWIAHIQATVVDIQSRRAALQAAMLPDDGQTSEMGSAAAQTAAEAAKTALMQSGGVPQGMMTPDPRMMQGGQPTTSVQKTPAAEAGMPAQTPDIAAPGTPDVNSGAVSPAMQ